MIESVSAFEQAHYAPDYGNQHNRVVFGVDLLDYYHCAESGNNHGTFRAIIFSAAVLAAAERNNQAGYPHEQHHSAYYIRQNVCDKRSYRDAEHAYN